MECRSSNFPEAPRPSNRPGPFVFTYMITFSTHGDRAARWQPAKLTQAGSTPARVSKFMEVRNAGVLIGLENRDDPETGRGGSSPSASARFHPRPGVAQWQSGRLKPGRLPVRFRPPGPFPRMRGGAVTRRFAKARPTFTGGPGSIPGASATLPLQRAGGSDGGAAIDCNPAPFGQTPGVRFPPCTPLHFPLLG